MQLIKPLIPVLTGARSTMSYLKLVLRATKPETNLDRCYEIHLCQRLFNSWLVVIAYGRYGAKGRGARQKTHSFFVLEEAKNFIGKTLNKRFSAVNRIGCNYKIIRCVVSADLSDVCLQACCLIFIVLQDGNQLKITLNFRKNKQRSHCIEQCIVLGFG